MKVLLELLEHFRAVGRQQQPLRKFLPLQQLLRIDPERDTPVFVVAHTIRHDVPIPHRQLMRIHRNLQAWFARAQRVTQARDPRLILEGEHSMRPGEANGHAHRKHATVVSPNVDVRRMLVARTNALHQDGSGR